MDKSAKFFMLLFYNLRRENEIIQINQQRWMQSTLEEKMLDNDKSTKMDAKHPGKENVR